MIDTSKTTKGEMGNLNNEIVKLIDASSVSPPEAIVVLKLLHDSLLRAFEARAREDS